MLEKFQITLFNNQPCSSELNSHNYTINYYNSEFFIHLHRFIIKIDILRQKYQQERLKYGNWNKYTLPESSTLLRFIIALYKRRQINNELLLN